MKYIVYETTNLVNNKIYIGVHKTINPDVFDGYIGCGVLCTQPYTYMHPKTKFQYAVKKYGPKNFRRKVLAVFDTLEEASNLERELVNETYLQRDDVYNMILGGVDDNFYKIVKCYQYDLEGNFIKEYESIKSASIELGCDHGLIDHAIALKIKGKNSFWTNVKYDKLDVSSYNHGLNHQVPVHVYLKTGEYYKSYPNCTQASKDLGISGSSIKDSRIFGILVKNKYYFCTVKDDIYPKARKIYIESRKIYKYDGETLEFLEEFEHQIEAEEKYPTSNICKAIKMKTKCDNGYFWGLEKLNKYGESTYKKKQVGKYTLDGELVTIYPSATAAAKENGTSVWKVLNGTNKTQKGHIYKYLS